MKLTRSNFYYIYLKNKMGEVLGNPKLIPFYFDRLLKYRQADNFDCLLISYPKSGRTWMQKLLGEVGRLGFNKDGRISTDTPISEALSILAEPDSGFPSILATHAKSSWEQMEGLYDEDKILEDDFDDYGSNKIIYLHRDPRDVLVSQYYHLKFRNHVDHVEKDDLISSKIVGVKKIVHFMNKWLKYSDQYPEQVLRLSYEEMKKDTAGSMGRIFDFLNVEVSDEVLSGAVDGADIKKMQAKQASKDNKDPWTKTKDTKNINSFQSRKGKVGEHTEFFSAEQLTKINQIIADSIDPRYGY